MEKNLEKSLKRYLKRKVKITTAFIVAFLLGSLSAFGEVVVKYENSEIKFYRDGNLITDQEELQKLGTVTGNPTEGFTWTINGEIPEQGQGQIIVDNIKDITFNIINNGKIINGSSSGSGIYNYNSTIENIENNGIISGDNSSSGGTYSGNGIINNVARINNIENYGTILGSSTGGSLSGNGIANFGSTIENIENNGTISGNSSSGSYSGNGIYNYYTSTIESIKNYGRISSENNMGNAILNENSTIKNIINNGMILGLGNEKSSANGIYNIGATSTSTIENIINHRIIAGKSSGGDSSGNGIVNYDNNNGSATIKNIINDSIVSGSGSGTLSGNGILNYNSVIENIANSGIVSGNSSSTTENKSGNGIVNFNATINNLKNYGIIAGSNKAVDNSSEIKNQENFGLLIDGAGKDTQKITAGAGGEKEIPVFNDDGSQTTETKFIINGAEGENAVALNSSDLKNKVTGKYFTEDKYQNLIINVAGDKNNSLNINEDFNISHSIINGYKDAVVFSADKKTFTGNGVNINAGGNTFTGSNSSDSINLSESSIVNGNINLGDGEDKITFNTSVLNGDVTADKDIITFDKSQINGNITSSNGKITISGGENTLFNTGSSVINGNIILTDGEISIADGTQINGKINLEGNKATVWLDRNQSLNKKINITATEKILGLNYNVNGVEDINSIKNQVGTFKNIQLADGGNSNVDLGEITGINSIKGGKGDDRFIVSIDELQNITIDGGADSSKETLGDTLELTERVENRGIFDNINNMENLQLASVDGNNLDINKLVTADGNIKFKNYIGGDKKDEFTVSVKNFEKVSLIDGGADGTDKGDTLTINGNESDKEVFLNKTTEIENFIIASSRSNIIDIDGWAYLNNNENKININAITGDISIRGNKENIKNLQNIRGNGNNTRVILTDNISENENYDFISRLNKIHDLYLSNGDNYVDIDKIIEINSTTNSKLSDRIQYIALDNISQDNNGNKVHSGTNYFKISAENLNPDLNPLPIKIDVSGSTSTEDTLEIITPLENSENLSDFFYGIEKLVLSGKGNNILINSDLVDNGFNEIIAQNSGENTFTINERYPDDKILGMKIEGGSSANDKLIVNTEIKTGQLSNKTGIENLELGLNKDIDYTIDFTKLKDFKNIKSGNGSDHFTVSVNNIGNMTIDGGGTDVDGNGNLISKDHDKLILSGILNNDTEKNKDILKEVKNIEDLELDNKENILNLNNIKLGTEENGFKNIYGGNGNDTFKISAENLGKIDILKGEIQQGTDDSDKLEITSGNIDENNTNLLNKVSGVENLILAENSSNNIDLDNLTFKNITAENGNDTFKISADNLGNFTVTGGIGNDTLEVKTILTNNANLVNYKGFETLKFDASGNNVVLTKENADGDSFKNINFGTSSIGNTITLANDLGAKNITFETLDETNKVSVDSTGDVNGVKTFKHTVKNAGEIKLNQGNFEWKFADNTINNTSADDITKIDLGTNTLNLLNNEKEISDPDNIPADKIINSGNIGLQNGNLVFGDLNFVANGKVEVTNGKIKIGFDSSVKFESGAETTFTLNGGNEIAFGTGVTFTSPYKFIKINGKEISVKQWNEYKNYDLDFSLYAGRYDSILKKYDS